MTGYLSKMYGQAEGYAALAVKGLDGSWRQQFFTWPDDRASLVQWVRDHTATGNVFICPALRSQRRRVKGDGVNLRWLWADVDMQQVRNVSQVRDRIFKIGTLVVASGTGDNRHVYVRLNRAVSVQEHERLNTGLRDYLSADNKQSDETLLRPPGTRNHKPGAQGSLVRVVGGHGRRVSPETLSAHETWQAVRVVRGGVAQGDWSPVDMSGVLKGRVRALARMSSGEATGRFGSRHRAIYAVVREFNRRGFTRDQIHSLLDAFPPAVEKAEDENGAYEVHKDIDRVLLRGVA